MSSSGCNRKIVCLHVSEINLFPIFTYIIENNIFIKQIQQFAR